MNRGTIAVLAIALCFAFHPPTAGAKPFEPDLVPPRTALSFRTVAGGSDWSTPNEHESRAALSLVKLYLADYALRHGDGAEHDRELAEQMIRYSDDGAASAIEAKYPQAIDAVAAEYELSDTQSFGEWGLAATSTADVADFLIGKLRTDPGSPIFEWMAAAGATAADGTEQDWGTARWPFVRGTKWGWSDIGPPDVASASYGTGFVVVAHTHGTAAEQTLDLMAAFPMATVGLLVAN
ncbi:hypothetical protein [Nocardia suismassiliense]|uniref:hypothetical protein n=1 Tax=Nocardia suismassiliense TaxID=2077092 RepID=UPI000D1E9F66|nr:hypothetical protein [Nocardia suismassiliense]